MAYNDYLLKMVCKITFILKISLLVAFCGAQNSSLEEKKFDAVQSAVFSGKAYPRLGEIPVLNRKVFRATRVRAYEHPYIASIRRLHVHYLTGTIISDHIVITVAHPLYKVPSSELGVVLGETYNDRGSAYITVLLVLTHKDFNPRTLLADVALLRLYDRLFVKTSQKPIPIFKSFETLHSNSRQSGHKIAPQHALVTGWGRCDWIGTELCLPRSSMYYPDEKQDPILRTVSFNHNRLDESPYCIGYEKNNLHLARDQGMLCVGVAREEEPLAPCLAVPGAPLTIGGMLVGVLSWGFGCGYVYDLPLIYTDVRYFSDWINESVVILEALNEMHLTSLFVASKAYIVEEWVSQTIERKEVLSSRAEPPLRATDLDKELALLKGTVTDFRDFAFGRKFEKAKADIYENLRNVKEDKERLRGIYLKYMLTSTSRPFFRTDSVYD